jgi:hypothetical protein
VLEGDTISIVIDRKALVGSVDFVGSEGKEFSVEDGTKCLNARVARADLKPHPGLPDDTRLWAALVQASGGVWAGCVYDTEAIVERLKV